MTLVKTNWLTYWVVAGVLGVLTLFIFLLYNWQLAASVAEREQMQRRVEVDTKAFADEFNREIQAAFFNFQVDPAKIAVGDASELDERHAFWQSNTAYPNLIQEFVAYTPEGGTFRYSTGKILIPVPPEEQTNKLREEIENSDGLGPILDDPYTLVVPLHAVNDRVEKIMIRRKPDELADRTIDLPKPDGYLIVRLSESVIKTKILPELAAKHFPSNEYAVAVADRAGNAVFQTASGASADPDAKAALFDLTPDSMIFFSNRELLPRRQKADEAANIILDQRVERRTSSTEANGSKGETFTIEMKEAGEQRRTAVISSTTAGGAPWRLNVQHSSGSIDAYIQGERYKSFAIGLGIYLLLVGSIIAIVFSSLRAKAFAQRQIDFVSNVSHEFRTPLAVIYTAGENLADGIARDNDQVARYGDLIKGEGKKLSGMVEQILEFAGARSRKKQYNLSAGDVSAAVTNALADSKPLLKEGGFEVKTSVADTLPNAQIDREAIETAVRNLIQNAVKYSNGTRWLKVSTENGGGSIKIVVEDRGIGISAGDRKKIFEPFYRAKDVVDAQIHGNGLGLSLVKEIAEAHGGKVSVESEIGKGSRFLIEVPLP
ncbi:MAG: sensor histidine kinase [Pyrinomonadaceae bacterium]